MVKFLVEIPDEDWEKEIKGNKVLHAALEYAGAHSK